jgi:MFS family permease
LPVIQSPPSEDADALERSGPKWLLIGAAFTIVAFLPLSLLSLWAGSRLARRFASSETAALLLAALPVLLAYAAAAWGAGAVIGRFGLRAQRAVPAASGALAGTSLVLLAVWRGAGPWQLVLGAACIFVGGGAMFAALGARFGRKRRPGLSSRA